MINSPTPPADAGPVDARYLAFLEVVAELRPRLHRFCARMVGSAVDGEDMVQEALFSAFRRLDDYDSTQPMQPWLLSIAHNRCVDHLRRKGIEDRATIDDLEADGSSDAALTRADSVTALERLVSALPPKERACVLLKDVLDYPLQEIAVIVDSTTAGVKAALHRGRTKLAALAPASIDQRAMSEVERQVLRLYAARFEQGDWDGVVALARADARLEVVDRFYGTLRRESPFFRNAERVREKMRFTVGEVDSEPVVIRWTSGDGARFVPHSVVRLTVLDDAIVRVRDYGHCPWILTQAAATNLPPPPSSPP